MTDKMSNAEQMALIQKAADYGKNRDFDQAIETLKKLTSAVPTHELGLGMLASIYVEIGMQERAIDLYQRIILVNPGNPLARLQLGLIQLKMEQIEQALDTWRPALTDEDFMLHFHSGLALHKLNKIDEAKQMFEHAAKTMPHTHALYGQLQDIRKSLG